MRKRIVAIFVGSSLALLGDARAEVCLMPHSQGFFETQSCDGTPFPIAVRGFDRNGENACRVGECSSDGGSYEYEWSISASSTDPFVNSGELERPVDSLFLWLTCSSGYLNAGFAIQITTPELMLIGVSMRNGVLAIRDGLDLQTAVGGCPYGPLLVARLELVVLKPMSVESERWGRVKAMHR